MGHEVEIRLYQPLEGRKSYVGTLEAYDNGTVTILSGQQRTFAPAQIAQVRLHISL